MFSRILYLKKDFNSTYLGESIVNLLDNTFQLAEKYDAQIMEVTEEYTARPDLLAHDIYGDVLYTDILCKVNGISNPFELNEGMYIIVPTIDSLDNFVVEPLHTENVKHIPKPKKTTERRRPSDAIEGNPRFHIDEQSEIIRY